MADEDADYIYSVDTGLGEDSALLHVPEERRPTVGRRVAAYIDSQVRQETPDKQGAWRKKLCPGCVMAVVVNALIKLAKDNGWHISYVRDHINRALDDLVDRETKPSAPDPMSAPDAGEAVIRAKYAAYLESVIYDIYPALFYSEFKARHCAIEALPRAAEIQAHITTARDDLARLQGAACITCLAPKEFH